MKRMRRNYIAASVLGGFLAVAGLASAQEATTQTTTTTSNGTVSDFTPSVITVHTVNSATPVAYSFSKTTTYVDENGNPVSTEVIRSGAPVTVYYTQDGDRMIADKVVVHKTTTTTTTTPSP